MSFMPNMQPPSMNLKEGEQSTVESERDYYRQCSSNMMLIVKELQEQLAQYKERCAGIDTFAVMLKEAKQESVTLARQKKVLETAVTNLQNRLSTYGLSSQVNIEETDVYVPGTSKQTLDNLARENARLRSLLKSAEYQPGNKTSEELQKMKALVEDLESGKNQLQAQLQEMEGIKMCMVKEYEEKIANLKESGAEERLRLQREVEKYQRKTNELFNDAGKNSDKNNVNAGKRSVEAQTPRFQVDMIDGLKQSLKHLKEQCTKLDGELENLYISGFDEDGVDKKASKEESGVTKEALEETERKLQEVTLMNQRWQVHNDTVERQHMSNLAELKNEIDAWRNETEVKNAENIRLAQLVENLQRSLAQLRQQQTQFDPSIVEILRQQIQVCTEDFNNERKDHEQAIKKNKSLQTEVDSVKAELQKVKQELERVKMRTSPVPPPLPHLEPRQPQDVHSLWGPYSTPQQNNLAQATARDSLPTLPQFQRPRPHHIPNTLTSISVDGPPTIPVPWAQSDAPFNFECEAGSAQNYALNNPHQFMSHSATDIATGISANNPTPNSDPATLMPRLRRRCSDIDMLKNNGVMSCPKCSKEFPEDQTKALLSHIDECKD